MSRIDLVKHQPRERAVRCVRCFKRPTFEHDAVCSHCRGRARRRALAGVGAALALVAAAACNPLVPPVHPPAPAPTRLACPHAPSSCHPFARLAP